MSNRTTTKTGGRAATTGTIDGDFALSVGVGSRTPPTGWQWLLLTDVARLETGHTPSRKHPEYWDGEIPWVGIRDATGNHGRIIHNTEQRVTQAGIENSSARLLPKHTVCLSRTASVGYVIVMGRPMATSQDFVNWICDPDALDYRYLKYVLLAEKNAFSRFAHGTTHQTIYFPEVKAFHVCAPDVDGQRAIADVLSALDDKIEQNRRTARALERLARAIFRAWFVDFEPVKAKAAGATAFPSMPHEVFDALPTRFVDSEIGPIPEGWEVKEFGDIAAQVRLSAKPDEIDPETPYIGLEHMPRRNFALSEWEAVSKVKSNKSRFREGQFLFGKLRPYFHKVGVAPIDGVSSTDIIVLEPRIESLFGPALGLITSDAFVDHATACSSGTKMPRTNWKDMSSFRLAIGPPEIMAAHTALIKPFVDSVVAGIHESHRLAEMRDYLLPKLLSGRVHVDVTEEPRMETT